MCSRNPFYMKMLIPLIIFLKLSYVTSGQPGKCDQTPPQAVVITPSENKGVFQMAIENAERKDGRILYTPDQTYVLTISTTIATRPFKWFMITAEDPAVDNNIYESSSKLVDVGSLKTLDTDRQARYSERCYNSVENTDNSDKSRIEIHWVSPKQTDREQKVRIRAMVAENYEVWYTGENLTILLEKDNQKPRDSPPFMPKEICTLCSEARYEVIFNGRWSRVSHPRHYPTKPDENGYSHMVGASHSYNYTLWQQGARASQGLQLLAEEANVTIIERDIIKEMSETSGTRTLIRGRRRHHPYMFEPSHSLFRVDKIHHLFSIVVGMRPSPDWFLGTSKFELCGDDGWLEKSAIPLYPWDAGTMDGVSYESAKSVSQPVDNIERVEVGSFNRESPFYQLNLNDLKPFAILEVRRLDVFPLEDCEEEDETEIENGERNYDEEKGAGDEPAVEPVVAESKLKSSLQYDGCGISQWTEWSPCSPSDGNCGSGSQKRLRFREQTSNFYSIQNDAKLSDGNCDRNQDLKLIEYQNCNVDCN